MEYIIELALTQQTAYKNMLAAAQEARLAKQADPKPANRLGVVVAATAILLGMVLVLAVVL